MTDQNTSLSPVAFAKTDFPQKFGIPKQPLMVENLYAELHFKKEFSRPEFFEGLEKGQAIWAIFLFHLHGSYLKATIRPPALGGKVRHGIFSSRSPHRPNPIGLSLLIFENLRYEKSGAIMKVKGADFTDGTPILDIKPYLGDFDRPQDISSAPIHWAEKKQKDPLSIKWEEEALISLNKLEMNEHKKLIEDILKLDPRPTSQRDQVDKIFYQDFKNLCLQWQVKEETLSILSVKKIL
jgi:tRNA-Thr(GGU) m(6)t(6)A37 methyltransferase TsaA